MSYYECDPRKHPKCRGGICQVLCYTTSNPEWSTDGKEMTEQEYIEFDDRRQDENRERISKYFRHYAERDQTPDQRGTESGHRWRPRDHQQNDQTETD